MFARIISEMEDVAKKSVEAPDDGSQPDLSSGYKLEEVLKSAKDMKKRFFWSIFGAAFPIEKNIDSWVPAKVDIETFKALAGPKFDEAKFKELLPQEKPLAAGEGEEEHAIETVSREKLTEFGLEMSSVVERFLAVYKRSRRTLKVIKGKQGGTLGTLMYLIDAPTAKWMALYLITRACESATQPARLYATNHLIADAMKPNWRALVPRDIMCFAAFHVYDFFINDVSLCTSANPAILRTFFYETFLTSFYCSCIVRKGHQSYRRSSHENGVCISSQVHHLLFCAYARYSDPGHAGGTSRRNPARRERQR